MVPSPSDPVDEPGPHWPALDALRGLSVLAVLLYHHDHRLLPGGFLGVTFFFVLSGFLITNLVLREHERTGRLDLRRFWARRFRRLAPVALAGLALALLVSPAVLERDRLDAAAGDIAAAALHAANWRAATGELEYGQTMEVPSPVAHYWSLAIEEQFYLAFPVLAALALRKGRRGLAVALAAALGLALVQSLRLDDANRIYLGTDTRSAELAIGGLVALVWAHRRCRPAARSVEVLGAGCLAAFLVLTRVVDLSDRWLYQGGLAAVAGLAGVVVLGSVGGRLLPWLGAVRPLTWLGLVSYGAYVVHFPLYLLLSADRLGVDGPALLAVRVVVSVVAAAALRWLVEQPVRIGGALARWQAPVGFATAVGAVLVMAVAVSHLPVPRAPDALVTAGGITVMTAAPATPPVPPPSTEPRSSPTVATGATATSMVASVPDVGGVAHAPALSGIATTTTAPAPTPASPPRLLVVGDSTAIRNGEGMQRWASLGTASVDVAASHGCTFFTGGELYVREGWIASPSALCRSLAEDAAAIAPELGSDALVIFTNNMALGDWRTEADPTWRSFGDPVFEDRFRVAARAALGRLSAPGVPVLVADLLVPEWIPELTGMPIGVGEPTINDAGRTARYNELMAELAAEFPLVRVVPFASQVVDENGRVPVSIRPDGLHIEPAAIPAIMETGFASHLQRAYADVVASGAVDEPRSTSWSP